MHQGEHIQTDLVYVLDATSSMQPYIDGARDGMIGAIDAHVEQQLDTQIGLVVFRDELIGEKTQWVPVGTPPETIKSILARTHALGGGDPPESSLPAIVRALGLPGYRPGARKVILHVTDAPPHDPECGLTSDVVLAQLKQEDALFFACTPKIDPYLTFCNRTGGTLWELTKHMSSDSFCDLLVREVGPVTAKTVKRSASSETDDFALEARRTLHR